MSSASSAYTTPSGAESSAGPSSGYNPAYFLEALSPATRVEKAIAWFQLVFGWTFLAIGAASLARIFHVRDVFEIKARSPYLVILNGFSLLGIMGLVVWESGVVLRPSIQLDVLDVYIATYFFAFAFYSSFWARVTRLGLAYCPRARKKFPWLMSERLLGAVSLLIATVSVSIPLHYWSMFDGALAEWDFAVDQADKLVLCQWTLFGITALCIPVVWRVDDLFRISREMLLVVALQLLQNVGGEMVDHVGDSASEWWKRQNVAFLASVVLFGVIVIDPIRRLAFNPMSKTYPALARAQDRRRQHGLRALTKHDLSELTEAGSFHEYETTSAFTDHAWRVSRSRQWSYEIIAGTPAMAAAFRAFAFRALCQESVLFLEEIVNYQNGDFSICSDSNNRCQRAAFLGIVNRFIVDGSIDEVNISGADKKKIMELVRNEAENFDMLDDIEKRTVFGKAYVEIRYMLETNLLRRFMETAEFKEEEKKMPWSPSRPRWRGKSNNLNLDIERGQDSADEGANESNEFPEEGDQDESPDQSSH